MPEIITWVAIGVILTFAIVAMTLFLILLWVLVIDELHDSKRYRSD